MRLVWEPLGLASLLALMLGWTLAGLVFWLRPDRPQNRRLALVIVVVSTLSACVSGLRLFLPEYQDNYGIYGLFVTLALVGPLVYVRFLLTLDSPLLRPFRSRVGQAVLVAYTLGALGLWFTRPELFIADFHPLPEARVGEWATDFGPLLPVLVTGMGSAALLYGLAVAISAHRRASPGLARRQTQAYAWAFGLRDGLMAMLIVYLTFGPVNRLFDLLLYLAMPLVDVLFIVLVTYGILSQQLFDIDLRIQRTIRGSTVASAFAGAFFLASEGIEQLLPVEGTFFGILAAALVALVLRPLQRFAQAISARALPDAQDTPEYREARKREVYAAALAELQVDGALSEEDQLALARVRARLGLVDAAAE